MRAQFWFLFMTLFFSSCASLFNDVENLGSNYYLLKDGFNDIIYSEDRDCAYRGEGYALNGAYENVTAYNKSKKYIIFRTNSSRIKDTILAEYWVIDKEVSVDLERCRNSDADTACHNKTLRAGLTGPFDSLTFYKRLDSLKIKMELKHTDD